MKGGTEPSGWPARIRARLAEVAAADRWRSPREFDARGPRGTLDGASVVSFASNDYLGLSMHPAVVAAAREGLGRWGAGSGASRLITGTRPVHAELERALADWKGTEAAVCFPTGFATNLGVLSVLGGPGVRVFSDELNHASIIDGCRLSRSNHTVYRHADVCHLEQLLSASAAERGDSQASLVVTDSVFSMDGDTAPLGEILRLCEKHDALLVVDEAHAVLGAGASPRTVAGSGSEHLPADPDGVPVVRVGTLSKTLGSIGGYVAASRDVVDLLVNSARTYIFSTAPAPGDASAALAALRVVRSPEGSALIERLTSLVGKLIDAGIAQVGHASPIVPVVVGSESGALEASASLLAQGLWVPAIRPPTVPEGTSRLRVTLSAAHSDRDVERLVDALRSVKTSTASFASCPSHIVHHGD